MLNAPLVDAVDSGSNKLAVQQCNKVLKKYPNLDVVKVNTVAPVVNVQANRDSGLESAGNRAHEQNRGMPPNLRRGIGQQARGS